MPVRQTPPHPSGAPWTTPAGQLGTQQSVAFWSSAWQAKPQPSSSPAHRPEQLGMQKQMVPSLAVQMEPQPSSAFTHLSVQSGTQQFVAPWSAKQTNPQPSSSPMHFPAQSGTQAQSSAPLCEVQTLPQPS